MNRLLVLVLSGVVLMGGRVCGQDEGSLELNDELRQAARLSLAQGVGWLKQRAAVDPGGWVVGPVQFAKLRDYTNITARWSKKVVWVPVYSYEKVVTFVQDTVGAPLRKVVQPRVVKQIGSNSVERLMPDPDGSVVTELRVPLYDAVGNISWTARGIGDAAMAAYALRKAGVPDTDPVLDGVLNNLRRHIDTFGLPDQTWNLAWLTVVFSGMPGQPDADLTQRLASRLLDGQILDGTARGFWGTLCIHHGFLAVMVRDYLAMLSDLQKKELRLKDKFAKEKNAKTMQAGLDELRETMERRKALTESEVCQRAFRFANVESSWVVDPQSDTKVMLAGADHLFYNQTVADIESTWVALFALSVAAENRRLPVQSWRPKFVNKLGSVSSTLPMAERSEAVFARAANALVAKQTKEGLWDECNQHQPVTKYDAFAATLPVPSDPKSFAPLASPVTPLSAAQGIDALDCIGQVVGMKRLMNGFKAPYLAGVSAARKEIETRLAAVCSKPNVRPVFSWSDYGLILTLSHSLVGLAEAGVGAQDNDKLLRALVLAANPTGSWGGGL